MTEMFKRIQPIDADLYVTSLGCAVDQFRKEFAGEPKTLIVPLSIDRIAIEVLLEFNRPIIEFYRNNATRGCNLSLHVNADLPDDCWMIASKDGVIYSEGA